MTAAVAAGSTLVLVLAVRFGWLGDDVGRGANFCEAARNGLLKQPANTVSNAGFVLAGLLVAWRACRPDRLGDVLPTLPGMATAYACVVVLLGPASAAMHATQTAAGGHLDMLSMYLIAGFAASYALMRWTRRGAGTFAVLYAGAVLGCEAVGRWPGEIPVVMFAGNVAFGALLVLAVCVELAIWHRGESQLQVRFFVAAVSAMATAFVIWNLSKERLCAPHSLIQGHGVWHLLSAVAAYFLFRLYASERVSGPVTRERTPSAAPSSR